MEAKKKRKFPWFYAILALFVILGICLVAYGLSALKLWMADYEDSQPKYAADQIFNTYFKNPDIAKFIKETEYTISPAEDFSHLEKYVKDQIGDGEITYSKTVGSIDGKEHKYVVSAGDYKFAQFTVVDSGERTEYNNPVYVLGGYEFFYVTETTSVKVTAPGDAKVSVNGYELDESYIVSTKETDTCKHMPSVIMHNDNTAQGIKYSTYVIDGLLYSTEDIKVTDKYGAPCTVTKLSDGSFSADINYNAEIESAYSEKAMDFAVGYAKYAQACGKFNDFSHIMDENSDIYQKVRTLHTNFVRPHETCEFTDSKISECYEYSPEVFSCRVSFTWHAYKDDGAEVYEYIDMTLYFHKSGEDFVLYHMLTHSNFE